jgi:PAS domain S-box-containing protein
MQDILQHAPVAREAGACAEAWLRLDAAGEICACNDAAAELLGGSENDLRGRPINALIPALPLRRHTPGYNRAYVDLWYARGARQRLLAFKRDGGALPLDVTVRTVKADRSIAFVVGMRPAHVVAERDPGLADLERSLDGAAEAAMVFSREGIIEYVNRAFETLTGFARDEAVGRTPAILRSGVQGREFCGALWQTLRAGKCYHGRVVNRRKDGTNCYEDLTIRPFVNSRGAVTHFVALGTMPAGVPQPRGVSERPDGVCAGEPARA